jgi:hypothetical protein
MRAHPKPTCWSDREEALFVSAGSILLDDAILATSSLARRVTAAACSAASAPSGGTPSATAVPPDSSAPQDELSHFLQAASAQQRDTCTCDSDRVIQKM